MIAHLIEREKLLMRGNLLDNDWTKGWGGKKKFKTLNLKKNFDDNSEASEIKNIEFTCQEMKDIIQKIKDEWEFNPEARPWKIRQLLLKGLTFLNK